MAQKGQAPPKGKVDVFDVLANIRAQGDLINPTPALRHLHALTLAGAADATVDEQSIRQKYAEDPRYKGQPKALDSDIGAAQAVWGDFVNDKYRPSVRVATSRPRLAQPAQKDQFDHHRATTEIASGDTFDTEQRMAAAKGEYIDVYGTPKPLYDLDRNLKTMYVDHEQTTDRYGRLTSSPVLREARYFEPLFDKNVVSKFGDQPRERTWGGALGASFINSVLELPAYASAGINNTWGDTSKRRLRTMVHMHETYGAPTWGSTADKLYSRGDMSPGSATPVNWAEAARTSEERAYEIYNQLKDDEERIRALAKEGDRKSQLDANIIDLGDGLYGHTALERLMMSGNAIKHASGISESERAQQQGAFGGMEGFSSAIGSTVGFMLPQMGVGRGMAGLLLKAGERGLVKGLVTTGLENGARQILTRAGANTVRFTAATAPSLQMAAQGYDVAREAGYGHEDAKGLMAMYGLSMVGSEMLIGTPWMVKSYLGGGGRQAYEKMIEKTLKGTATQPKVNAARQLWNSTIEFLKKGSSNQLVNRGKNAVEAAWTEGWQEMTEEGLNAFGEDLVDHWSGRDLFAAKRGPTYSFGERILEAGAIGAIAGGGISQFGNQRRAAAPDDPRISEAVAEGKSEELRRTVREMHANGAITDQDLSVIEQDIELAKQVMSGLSVGDPQTIEKMRGMDGMFTTYARLNATLRAKKSELASMAEGDVSQEAVNKRESLLKSITEDEEGLKRIQDGSELVRRYKEAALLNELVRKGRSTGISAEAIDAVTQDLRSNMERFNEERSTAVTAREQGVPVLNKAINDLISSEPAGIPAAMEQMLGAYRALVQGKALSKQDSKKAQQAMMAARQKALMHVFEQPDPASADGATLMGRMVAYNQANENAELDGAQYVREIMRTPLMAGEFGEDAREGYKTYEGIDQVMGMFGTEEQQQMRSAGLPDESDFGTDQPGTRQLFNAMSRPLKGDVERLRGRTGMVKAELPALTAMAQRASLYAAALDAYRGPLKDAAKQIATPAARKAHPGIEAFAQEADAIYVPASQLSQEQVDEVHALATAVQEETERLRGLLNVRESALNIIGEKDLALRARMIELYAEQADEPLSEELAQEVARVADRNTDKGPDPVKLRSHVLRAELLIGRIFANDHKAAAKAVSTFTAWYGQRTGGQATYPESVHVKRASFNNYHDPSVFASEGPFYIAHQAALQHYVNWVSRLTRIDQAALVNAYNDVLSGMTARGIALNTEQHMRALEVISFLANPDQSLTDALVMASGTDRAHWQNERIEHSILLPGSQGTGKTTTAPIIIETLTKLKGRSLRIAIVAPGMQNAEHIANSLSRRTDLHYSAMKLSLDEIPKIEQGITDEPFDLLLFDEAHAIDPVKAEQIRQVMTRLPDAAALFLGDHDQAPSLSDTDSLLPVERKMLRTMPMTVSFRHTDIELLRVMEDVRPQVFASIYNESRENVPPEMGRTRYVMKDGMVEQGVRTIADDPSVVIDQFASALLSAPARESYLIVLDEKQRSSAIARLRGNTKLMAAVPFTTIENKVRVMDKGVNSVLGLESDHIFIAFDGKGLGSQYARFLYTAMGRARRSITMHVPGGRSEEVDSLPSAALTPNELASLRDQGKALAESDARVIGPVPVKTPEREPRSPRKDPPAELTGWTDQNADHPVNAKRYLRTTYVDDHRGSDNLFRVPMTVLSGNSDELVLQGPSGERLSVRPGEVQRSVPKKRPMGETQDDPGRMPDLFTEQDGWTAQSTDQTGSGTIMSERFWNQKALGVFTPTLDYQEGEDQTSLSNPAYAQRRSLLVAMSRSTKHVRVRLVVRKQAMYYNRAQGAFKGDAVEVHLEPSEHSRALVYSSTSDPELRENPRSMFIGTLPKETMAERSEFAHFLSALNSKADSVQDGEVIATDIRLDPQGFAPSILFVRNQEDEPVRVTELMGKLDKKGMTVSDPVFVPATENPTQRVGWLMNVSYAEGFKPVTVHVFPKTADNAYWSMLMGSFSDEVAAADTFEKLESTLAYSFILQNRSLLIEGGHLVPELEGTFVVRALPNGRSVLSFHPSLKLAERKTAMKKAVERLKDSGRTLYQGVRKRKSMQGFHQVHPADIDRLWTNVQDVNMPELLIDAQAVMKAVDQDRLTGMAPAAAQRATGIKMDRGTYFAQATDNDGPRTGVSEVREYYARVFGDRWLQSKLEFRPGLMDMTGRRLFGVMQNGRIVLDTVDGTIRTGIERHEAVHRVIEHLLDEPSRESILSAAREALALREGGWAWQFDDRQAHEHIASRYQEWGERKAKNKNASLLDRFIGWIKGVLRRFSRYEAAIANLLDRIESGEFHGMEDRRNGPSFYTAAATNQLGEFLPSGIPSEEHSPPDEVRRIGVREKRALGAIFGSPLQAAAVVQEVAGNIIRSGPYRQPSLDRLSEAPGHLRETLETVRAAYLNESLQHDDRVLQDGRERMLKDFFQEELMQLPPDVYFAYKVQRIADPEVFNMIAQAVFPNIDIERFMNDEHELTMDSADTDMHALDDSTAMVHDTNDALDPYDRASGFARMLLENQLLIDPETDTEGNFNQRIDLDLLSSIAAKAAQGSLYDQDGRKPYEVMGDRLLKHYRQDKTGRSGRHAYTLYKRFFDTEASFTQADGATVYSYAYMITHAERLRSYHASGNAFEQHLAYAKQVMNTVPRMFLELSTSTRMSTELYGDGRMRHLAFRFDEGEEEHRQLNIAVNSVFSVDRQKNVSISPDVRKSFKLGLDSDPQEAPFEISVNGVSTSDDIKLVTISNGVATLRTNEKGVIHAFFQALNYPVADSVLDRLLEGGTEANANGLLARIIGGWGMALHASAVRLRDGRIDTNGFSWSYLDQERRQQGGVAFLSPEELLLGRHTDEERPETTLPAISGLFGLNRKLAKMQGSARGTGYARRIMGVSGTPLQADTLGSAIKRSFLTNEPDRPGNHPLLADAQNALLRHPELKVGGRWTNPLYDESSGIVVNDIILWDGIKLVGDQRGQEVRKLQPADIDQAAFNLFKKHLLSAGRDGLMVPGHAYADRNVVAFFQISGEGASAMIDNGRLNRTVVDRHIRDRAVAYDAAQADSLARWSAHLGQDVDIDTIDQAISGMDEAGVMAVRMSTELMENRDYTIKGGRIMPGHAVKLDIGFYTADVVERLLSVNGSEQLRMVVEAVFAPQVQAYKEMREQNGNKGSDDAVEAMVYLHHLVDSWTSEAVIGSVLQYKDEKDWVKRSVTAFSPGHLGVYNRVPRVAIFQDPIVEAGVDEFDGQAFTTPWGFLYAREAYGGLAGASPGMMRQAVNKRIYVADDLIIKYSETPVTPRLYALNPFVRTMTERSLAEHPDLLELWRNGVGDGRSADAFWGTAQRVMEMAAATGRSDALVDILSSHHNIKMGKRAVNAPDGDQPLVSLPLDWRKWSYQTNLDRPLDRRNQKAPYMTQLVSLFGVMANNALNSAQIATLEAQIADKHLEELEADINAMPGSTPEEQLRAYLKELVLSRTAAQGDTGSLVETLMAPDASVQHPIAKPKVVQHLASLFNKRGFSPKMRGQMFSQSSAYGLTIARQETQGDGKGELHDNGSDLRTSVTDAMETSEEVQNPEVVAGQTQEEEGLSAEKESTEPIAGDRNTNGSEGLDAAPGSSGASVATGLQLPRNTGGYEPGEIVLPFLYAEEFGFKPGEWEQLSLNEVRDTIRIRMGEAGVSAFEDTLEVFVARTPASNTSSGHFMRIAEFISDAGNTIFVPAGFNKYTGGDFDGDQLSVIIKHVDVGENGIPAVVQDRGTLAGLQNALLANVRDHYEDPGNAQLAFAQVGTAMIASLRDQLQKSSVPAIPHTPTQAWTSRQAVFDGAALIGIIANTIKSYAFLRQAHASSLLTGNSLETFPRYVPPEMDSSGQPVLLNLSELLNGALDNVKLMVLGDAGIGPHNVQLVLGNLLMGRTLQEAVMATQDPLAQELSRMVREGQRLMGGRGESSLFNAVTAPPPQLRALRKQSASGQPVPADRMAMMEQSYNDMLRDRSALIQPLALFESMDRLNQIVGMNVKGVPVDEGSLHRTLFKQEHALSMPIDQVLEDRVPDPRHHIMMSPVRSDHALYVLREGFIRSPFNLVNVVRLLPQAMGFLRMEQRFSEINSRTQLTFSPAFRQLRQMALDAYAYNGYLPGNKENQWSRVLDHGLVSAYMQASWNANEVVRLLPQAPPIAIGTMTGMYRYVMEFPRYWSMMVQKTLSLPMDHPVRRAYMNNSFIQALRVRDGSTMVLEMVDARRYRDPIIRERLMRDAQRIDDAFEQTGDATSVSAFLGLYSMLKDRFSYDRNSLMHFLPPGHFTPYASYLDALLDGFRTQEESRTPVDEGFFPSLFSGRQVLTEEVFERWMAQAAVINPALLRESSDASSKLALYSRERVRGANGFETIVKERGQDTPLASQWSPLAPALDGSADAVHPRTNVTGHLTSAAYDEWLRSPHAFTDQTGRLLLSPLDGQSDALRLPSDTSATEEPGIVPFMAPATVTNDRYLDQGLRLAGLSIQDALTRISERSQHPFYKENASLLAERLKGSDVMVEEGDLFGSNRGYFDPRAKKVAFNKNDGLLDVQRTLLHEGYHVATLAAISGNDASPVADAFKKRVQELYDEAKEVLVNERRFGYYLSDLNEFVAGTNSDEDFQERLRSLESRRGSWWKRWLSAVRSLFGGNAKVLRNGFLDMVLDATKDYTRDGRWRDTDITSVDPVYRRSTNEDNMHGVSPSDVPIVDVRDIGDHLRSGRSTVAQVKQATIEKTVTHLYRRVMNPNRTEHTINGVPFSTKGMSEAEVLDLLRTRIVPQLLAYEERSKRAVVDQLNKGQDSHAWMRSFRHVDGTSMDEQEAVDQFFSVIDHAPENIYVRWSDLADPEFTIQARSGPVKVKDLNIRHVPLFEGHDPIIGIRKGEKGYTMVMTDMTSTSLSYRPLISGPRTRHLLSNYIRGTMVNEALRMYYGNDEGGVRSFVLAVQAMAIKKANPTIAFDRIQVVAMNKGGTSRQVVWMPDALNHVRMLKKTALYEKLPPAIQSVLQDESLYDGLSYKQSFMDAYMEFLRHVPADPAFSDKVEHERLTGLMQATSPDVRELRSAFVNRMRILEIRDPRDHAAGEEYQLLSKALRDLDERNVSGMNTNADLNWFQSNFNNAHHMPSDVLQWVQRELQNSASLVVQRSIESHREHVKWIEELDQVMRTIEPSIYVGDVIETGHKRFRRLMRRTTTKEDGPGMRVRNASGELIEASLPILHWDAKDPETAMLLNAGELTKTELDYANKVLDHIESRLVDMLASEYRYDGLYREADGTFNETMARIAAKTEVRNTWRRGWLPIVSKQEGESIMQGQFKQAARTWGRGLSNIDSLSDREFFQRETDKLDDGIANPYRSEVGEKNPSPIGGPSRLRRLGLEERGDGTLVLVDPLRINAFTFNVESVLKHLDVHTLHQQVHRERSLPVLNSAGVLLKAIEHEQGIKQTNNLAWLEDYARRMVYNKPRPDDGLNVFGLRLAPLAQGAITMTTYGGVALNMKVAAASLMYNQLAMLGTAVANGAAGNGLFGMDEWRKAVSIATTDTRKMRAMMIHLFVSESSEAEFLHSDRPVHSKTSSRVFTSHGMQVMNWWTDHMTRGMVMIAQMLKEGSWDAYTLNDDGSISYDQYLDRRWYAADGTKQKDANVLMDWVRQRLMSQGIHKQEADKPLVAGHDLSMGRTFKWIADKHILGAVDPAQRMKFDSYWYGGLFTQFRKFLPSKIHLWQGRRMATDEGGRLVVKEGTAVWERREIESYLGALLRAAKRVRDAKRLDLRSVWKDGDEADRHALTRLSMDLGLAMIMLTIYGGLKSLADDDDKEKAGFAKKLFLYDNRALLLFQQGAFDLYGGSLPALVYQYGKEDASPFPAIATVNRMMTGFFTNPDKLLRQLPGNTTFDMIHDAYADESAE